VQHLKKSCQSKIQYFR